MDIDINDITITDLIALIVIIGGIFLLSKGIDGVVGSVIIMVTSFYFGQKFKK